jgi:hypothetical protein
MRWAYTCGGLALLIGVNIVQNGPANHPVPKVASIDEALSLRTKADFVAAWKAAPEPKERSFRGKSFDAGLPGLGILAPVSSFITHQLFGGILGGPWLGKKFGTDGFGVNRFRRSGDVVTFKASVAPSRLDGKAALVLDYSQGDSFVWGAAMRMRDELREVAPGVWLGLGSFGTGGGIHNCATFVLWPEKTK